MNAIPNMTLRPTPQTLVVADPAILVGFFLFGIVEAVTFGTDVLGYLSVTGNSGFVEGEWLQIGSVEGYELWQLTATMAGAGSSVSYSIETVTNKALEYKQCTGVVPQYSS